MYVYTCAVGSDGSIGSMKEKVIAVYGIFWWQDILEGAIHAYRVSQIQHRIACSKTIDGRLLVDDIVENGDWIKRYDRIVVREEQEDLSC